MKNDNNILEPISISFHDGNYTWSFNILSYDNWREITSEAIKSILIPKYNGWLVYLHNFSRFDGVFILNILVTISDKVEPLIRETDLLNINIYYGTHNEYIISFRDTLLLIPVSLKELCKAFKVAKNKDIFPFKLL